MPQVKERFRQRNQETGALQASATRLTQKRPKSEPTAVPEHERGTLLEAYKDLPHPTFNVAHGSVLLHE